MRWNRQTAGLLVRLLMALLAPGCVEPLLGEGASCPSDLACKTGLCADGKCLDPAGDSDGDGLPNGVEAALGTSALYADTDGDGLPDLSEVGDPDAPNDTDSDGHLDALESATLDQDQDCLPAQLDPDDLTPSADPEALRALACPTQGLCGDHLASWSPECVAGGAAGAGTAAWVECGLAALAPQGWEAVEVSCDGQDNDCDGATDELAYPGPDGAEVPLGSPCQGVGACSALTGIAECGAAGHATCSVNADGSAPGGAATDLACNGADDDCDGVTDAGSVWKHPDTGLVYAIGVFCPGRGVCLGGVVECGGADGSARCSTWPGGSADGSAPEWCDTLDNDCDGAADEDLAWTSPAGASVPVGAACGVGVCAGGVVVCQAGAAICATWHKATPDGAELCNALDDDCDGATDEADGLARTCDATWSVGACAGLSIASWETVCDGQELACQAPGFEPGVELSCNGLDDDCDGATDEDFVTLGSGGTAIGIGQACVGVGACQGAPGTVACDAEGSAARCTGNAAAQTETCNGVDDDCDGFTDELADPTGACLAQGVCEDWVEVSPICAMGLWTCPYATDPGSGWEAAEATCDELDNDCDGLVDEALPKLVAEPPATPEAGQPAPRDSWPMVAGAGGEAWLFGGARLPATADAPPEVLGDLWRYDPAQHRWTAVTPAAGPTGPGPRAGHALAWEPESQRLLVHGGFAAAQVVPGPEAIDGPALGDLWAFDPATLLWSQVLQTGAGGSPVRRYHSLGVLAPGKLLLHGGLPGDTLDSTLLGTLGAPPQPGAALSCDWAPAASQPAVARYGHRWVADPGQNLVALAGGFVPGGGPAPWLAEYLHPLSGWTGLGLATEQPSGRFAPAAAAFAGQVWIYGGVPADPSQGPLAGGFRFDTGSEVWTPIGGSIPPVRGAALLPLGAPQALWLVGGRGSAGVEWRSSWPVDLAGLGKAFGWYGPAPRSGALCLADEVGAIWLLGGRRGPSAIHQDVWGRDPATGAWTALSALSPEVVVPTETRPQTELASGLVDYVSGVLLWFGGRRIDGSLSQKLWRLDLQSWAWQAADVQFASGDPAVDQPPGGLQPLFALHQDKADAYLFGVRSTSAGPLWPQIYRLGVATSTWERLASPFPGDLAAATGVGGGLSAAGLRVVVVSPGGFSAWTFDLTTGGWSEGAATPTGAPTVLAGAAHDAASDRTILALHGGGTTRLWVVEFGAAGSGAPLEGPVGAGVGMALCHHPSRGVLGAGGVDPNGVLSDAWWEIPQICE